MGGPLAAPARPAQTGAPDPGGRPQVYLHAGQLSVAAAPTVITTVLGSCVSVCLHDPIARVGGMNHFLLPFHVDRERSPRFGTVAVPQLIDDMVRAGASRGTIVAKVFGGASVVNAFKTSRNLGLENVALALRLLEEAHVPVLERDVGGSRGRKLIFHADVGVAWIRQL